MIIFESLGILKEVTGKKRGRRFIYAQYLAILEEGTQVFEIRALLNLFKKDFVERESIGKNERFQKRSIIFLISLTQNFDNRVTRYHGKRIVRYRRRTS